MNYPLSIAEATITDLVTGKVLKVEFGHVEIIKSYSKIEDDITRNNPGIELMGKTYNYNFLRFKTKIFKKYLRAGYPFKLEFSGQDNMIENEEITQTMSFLESTGKRVPYALKLLSVKPISNLEACERIERFRS